VLHTYRGGDLTSIININNFSKRSAFNIPIPHHDQIGNRESINWTKASDPNLLFLNILSVED